MPPIRARTTVAAPRIQDYAIIGDCHSAALVSTQGSIDWLCWPRFDSPALFAALLDPERGGTWRIAPRAPFTSRRSYVADSNVLMSRLATGQGAVLVTDAMTLASPQCQQLLPEREIVRLVECDAGEVELEVVFDPRPDFGRARVVLQDGGALGWRLESGRCLFNLRSECALHRLPGGALGTRVWLRQGQQLCFSLTASTAGPAVLAPLGERAREALLQAIAWWQAWAGRTRYTGAYRAAVVRSALAIKLLCFAPSGAVLAAPTTSLPERLGGGLNWDYRYCWIRDAAFTVRALLELGHAAEAKEFVSWLLHSTRLSRPRLNILYDIYGRHPGSEVELEQLRGYRGSRPVRLCNAAVDQLQLDTYGEVIAAAAELVRYGHALDRDTQAMLRAFGEYVCEAWTEPDHGIWEVRGEPAHYTHSKVLCWVALDQLLALHARGELRHAPAGRFAEQRDLIRRAVEERGFDPAVDSYVETLDGGTLDGGALDAGLILLSHHGFARESAPRMQGTARAIRARLGAGNGLFYRYERSLASGEGAFAACSSWMAEFLARGGGSLQEARSCFAHLLDHANDVGLLAEEIDPHSGDLLGNFPQTISHVALIGAALAIDERARSEDQRGLPSEPHAQLPERAP